MRKEWMALAACMALIPLAACSADAGPADNASEKSISSLSTQLDYGEIAENVGPIAAVTCWSDPSQIPVREVLGWYLRYYADSYQDAEDPFAPYRVESDPDFLYIPATTFEQAAKSFFGMDAAYLESESEGFYHSDSEEYIVPESLMHPPAACAARNSSLYDDLVQVQFDLSSQTLGSRSYVLTIDLQDGMRFVSCQELLAPGQSDGGDESGVMK